MARFAALLDACALVPIALADTLLRVAECGLYRPLWSAPILDEAACAVRAIHPAVDPALVARRFAAMTETFEDAGVVGWEPLVDGLTLPDANDRHVVAAAMRGGAQAVVTFNLTDFPTRFSVRSTSRRSTRTRSCSTSSTWRRRSSSTSCTSRRCTPGARR